MTSTKDDRVHPGHARKTAARLHALGQPYYYYENIDGGHSAAANLDGDCAQAGAGITLRDAEVGRLAFEVFRRGRIGIGQADADRGAGGLGFRAGHRIGAIIGGVIGAWAVVAGEADAAERGGRGGRRWSACSS